jgi:hypothetical protein
MPQLGHAVSPIPGNCILLKRLQAEVSDFSAGLCHMRVKISDGRRSEKLSKQ